MTSQKTKDLFMAYDMHEKLNCLGITENAVNSEKENYKPRTLIDETLELIDPTPNIHTLFIQFNARFFWNILLPVEVKWSNRMTSCAGSCSFHSYNKQCMISLSAPLLKLRPRKDLIETLLHEMIHGYLFLTNNDRDRDGHGPNFCKHMHRINKEAGTNITIYHNFHNEVRLYQQHWWKCNGPCQHRPPFFGTVRRAMNRAPGPSDYWWYEHQQNCNGQFIKIKEPENFKSRSKQGGDASKSIVKAKMPDKNFADWFSRNNPAVNAAKSTSTSAYAKTFTHTNSKTFTQANNKPTASSDRNNLTNPSRNGKGKNHDLSLGMKKLGNASNNVHGWSISGSSGKAEKDNARDIASKKSPKFACSGTLGGSNSGRSNLLTKFLHVNDDKSRPNELTKKNSSSTSLSSVEEKRSIDGSFLDRSKTDLVSCPICNKYFSLDDIKHIDMCLAGGNKAKAKTEINTDGKCRTKSTSLINEFSSNSVLISPIRTSSTPLTKRSVNMVPNKRLKLDDSSEAKYISCPVCNKTLPYSDINQHLDKECLLDFDECVFEDDTFHKNSISSVSHTSNNDSTIISISDSSSSSLNNSVVIESPKVQSCVEINAKKNNTTNHERKCLVCNAQIAPDVSLSEHLEECIGAVFRDDTMTKDDEDDNDVSVVENNSMENKYPCPVCMQIISENFMNQHLDMCLKD